MMDQKKTHLGLFLKFCIFFQLLEQGSGQLLANNGNITFLSVNSSETEKLIPCVFEEPDPQNPEIFLFQNRSVIATSKTDNKYHPEKGFTVKLPVKIPLTGISYECRLFKVRQKTTVRLIPANVLKSEPEEHVEAVIKRRLKLKCSTAVRSLSPLKIIHGFTDIQSGCNKSVEGAECDLPVSNETPGQYFCIQDRGNNNTLLQTQIHSRWTVETIPKVVEVKIHVGSSTVSCNSTEEGSSTPILELCPCQNRTMCNSLESRLKEVNVCSSARDRNICNLTTLSRPYIGKDELLMDLHVLRCYTRVRESRVNCNQEVMIYEPHIGIPQGVLIAVILVITVLLLVSLVLIIVYRQKFLVQKFKVQKLTEAEVEEFINGNLDAIDRNIDINDQAHLLPYNKDFEFPKANLHFEKQLGAGAYGTVMRARAEGLLDAQGNSVLTVAVKTVPPNAEFEYFKALLMELKIMIHIGHNVNVLGLLGAVTEKIQSREVYIIVEFCRFGDLQTYLEKNAGRFVNQIVQGEIDPTITKNQPTEYANVELEESEEENNIQLNVQESSAKLEAYSNLEPEVPDTDLFATTTLIRWCCHIAKGMEFLGSKKVIHGDLAARNVLITDGLVAKVADFGLARQVYKNPEYQKTQRQKLPIKWMALESLTRLVFSSKSDVWSFGITLHEIFTLGETPYPGLDIGEGFLEQLKEGHRMKQAPLCPTEIYKLMLLCWCPEPEDRPSFQDIGIQLGRIISPLDQNYTRLSMLGAPNYANTYANVPEPRYANL